MIHTFSYDATEALIHDNCGMRQFLKVADTLSVEHEVEFTLKEDNSDTIDWFFTYKGSQLMLHYNIYSGVFIRNNDVENHKAFAELTSLLTSSFC